MIPPDVQLMIDKICRSCMCESAEMSNVFEKCAGSEQETVLLSDMLMACAQIQVVADDGLPYLLCSICESKLNTAFEFKVQCEKSDFALRELTNRHIIKDIDDKIVVKSDFNKVLSDSEEDDVPLMQQTKIEKVNKDSSLTCEYCHKILPGKRALKVHTRLHKNDSIRYCPVCPTKYTRLNPLLKHIKKHNKDGKKFSCAICSSKYQLAEDLYQHLDVHKEELKSTQEKVKPIKVKIEVKEESDDITYELADKRADKSSEEIRIEIESSQKYREDDLDSMDIPLNQFPFSDNEDGYENDTEFENTFKKRKRGRPRKFDRDQGFPCSICPRVLSTNLGRKIHLKTHGIKPEPSVKRSKNKVEKVKDDVKQIVECEFCDRKFKYKKSYSQHMQMEHDMTVMDGDFDSLLTVQLNDGSDPDITSNNNQTEEASMAENGEAIVNGTEEESKKEISTSASTLMKISVNEINDQNESGEASVKKVHECLVCGYQFSRPNHLTRHMTFHRAVLTHKCDLCNQSFHKEELLKKHIEDEHANKPYICTLCKKSFTRGEHLIRHLKVHKSYTGPEPKCSICDATFSRLDHLTRHIKVHLMQDKRHICLDCGKAFNRLDNLRTHQRVHTGIKDTSKLHLCVYCGKEFNNSSNMIVHMRRHTGERPYKCSVCDKGFPRSHDLKCHERTHSGEKPYLCTLCGKSFNKSNKLLRHSRVHTGERPYVCNVCGRAFTQSNDLSLHMRRHTGARPYACGVCSARFIQSGQLKNHRRTTGHWMETQPDLKGGHRVEPVSGPIEPVPIRFKKYSFPTKKEVIEEDVPEPVIVNTDEQEVNENAHETRPNTQPHKLLMGIVGNLKLSQNDMQSLVIDTSKLVELQGGGLGIMTLPSVIQGTNGEQIKLKTELGTFSLANVEENLGKEEVVVSSSETYPEDSEAYTTVSTSTTYTTPEGFGFQTFD